MGKILDILGSFGLACILFLLALLLTFIGTLYQVDHGLYEAQRLYFDSFYVIHYFFDVVPVPLPGVFLIMCLLALNLIVGGMIRMRKDWKRAGVLIIHVGILIMLAGGLVKRAYATEGHMALHEGDSANEYVSYSNWELAIAKANAEGEVPEYIIPDSALRNIDADNPGQIALDELPFQLEVTDYMVNAQPMPASAPMAVGKPLDGVVLRELDRQPQIEQNQPGAYLRAKTANGQEQEGIVWGDSWFWPVEPWIIETESGPYAVTLRKKSWPVPFEITLDDFQMEKHPGTQMAASYSSFVTKTQGNSDQNVHISMNAPLRYKGYTVYQESWGPSNGDPNTPLWSQLRVVRNPSDQWPLYSCIVISIGLVLHFAIKLTNYLRAEARRANA